MGIEDFRDFFKAVNDGREPFPWQERLVRKVASERAWPRTIAVPTGCGKTSIIDAAVFLLACEAEQSNRVARLRTFFVVDRRLVVDQAEEHAQKLACQLANADRGILAEVANRLRRFGVDDPLRVAKLRGGMAYEGFWCEDPRQPTVVTSTVDQVGSRLLFRGYGCSAGRRPIEAGLVGNDSLIIVDEAHLSTPFLETLAAVQKLGAGIEWLQMSATARESEGVFRLEADDFADSVISVRVNADKPARLRKCIDFASVAVSAAVELSEKANVVGVVVNTVKVARKVFEALATVPDTDSILLIGRVRPLDRDKVLAEWLPRLAPERERSRDQRLFVVATQTVEVGADIDFDALVTEAAPLDVLRQRFGRLDRRGELGTSEAVILRGSEDFRPYGDATAKTWMWLGKHSRSPAGEKVVNFCISEMDDLIKQYGIPELFSPSTKAPPLLLPHIEAWCQTTGVPEVDPAVSPFLHGPEVFDADEVQVVWRADLEDDWLEAVMVAPPDIRESMPVPVWEVRKWLGSRQALIWRGADDDRTGMFEGRPIRAGDTIVVPSSYGGADSFGWHPESDIPVRDIGDETGNWVRLHPAFLEPPASVQIARLAQADEIDLVVLSDLLQRLDLRGVDTKKARQYGSGIIMPRKIQLMDDGDAVSVTTVPILLDVHSEGVVIWVKQFALGCGIEADQLETLIQAARFHDTGKADPRFQAILHGGDLLEAYRILNRGEVYAKSGASWTLADYRRMRAAVGYPVGARHEAGSVKVGECENLSPLALHLIAAHHGHARPTIPWWREGPEFRCRVRLAGREVEFETGSALGQIDSPVVDRFWSLCGCFGYWRLALLEGILRLADHRQSKQEMCT